jgi:hypothetical protein
MDNVNKTINLFDLYHKIQITNNYNINVYDDHYNNHYIY